VYQTLASSGLSNLQPSAQVTLSFLRRLSIQYLLEANPVRESASSLPPLSGRCTSAGQGRPGQAQREGARQRQENIDSMAVPDPVIYTQRP
jgi:hypothetical protein